ncbi:S41 family peptidase [Flavobacterium hauense]
MKKIMSLIALLLLQAAGAQSLSDTQKLEATARIWGFLKYYHPQVAAGKYNWDDKLIELLPVVEQVNTAQELSKVYLNWIDGLGSVPVCKKCSQKSKKDSFDKNFDMGWMENSAVFTPELTAKLRYIEANRLLGIKHYAASEPNLQIKVQNEPEYTNFEYPAREYRLLSLFRYWNIIEYFFPYKYQTDQKWNNVLTEMIPEYINAVNAEEYHLAMLKTVAKIDDSHAFLKSNVISNMLGDYWVPFATKIIDNKAVVVRLFDEKFCVKDDIRIGDAITHFNNKSIEELFNEKKPYIPASSEAGKRRNATASRLFQGHNNEPVIIKFERAGIVSEKTIIRYKTDDFSKKTPLAQTAYKKLDGAIGYVDMGILEYKDIKNMFSDLNDCKSIIFDLRKYPKSTGGGIAHYILPEKKEYAKLIYPDLDYPGKYKPIDKDFTIGGSTNKKNIYQGKIILLINESTQSQGEYTTMILSNSDKAVKVGSATAGADGDVSDFPFVGGYLTRISGLGVFYPDWRETQRIGIIPDIQVYPTIAGIQAGKDEELDKAIEIANQ